MSFHISVENISKKVPRKRQKMEVWGVLTADKRTVLKKSQFTKCDCCSVWFSFNCSNVLYCSQGLEQMFFSILLLMLVAETKHCYFEIFYIVSENKKSRSFNLSANKNNK